MKRLSILFMAILAVSCYKDVPPSDVVGNWKAVHENWTLVTNGKKTTESYDYAQVPSEDFAYLMLYHPSSFYMFSSNAYSEEKNMTMVYSDRFSPIVAGTSERSATTMSVRMRHDKIIGGDVVLRVVSVDREEMVIDYDSGEIASEGGGTASGTGGTVQRKCRFVFERVK